jgi:uncharacterized protein
MVDGGVSERTGKVSLSLDATPFNPDRRYAMSQSANHHKINYIEFAVSSVARAKQFYSSVFAWSFVDYGPDYASFTAASAGVDGGVRTARPDESSGASAPLIVLYSSNLEATLAAVAAAGGSIVAPIFSFPGGRRFHFADGVGNTLAVWSE